MRQASTKLHNKREAKKPFQKLNFSIMSSDTGGSSWATLLGSNQPTRNDNNVMEIVLEKDEKGGFSASDEEVAKALQKLGADVRPGIHIEGVQICPMGRNVIQVTLNKNVEMSRFFNKDVFELRKGLRVSHVRQSGKKEVTLTIKGLHPNTKDETVFKYLSCLGKLEKKKVIMDTFKEGPLCGLKNGTRKYSIELRQDISVGSLHYIDGARVNISFPGQKKLCYRCFNLENSCPGKGLARDCEANGGSKVLFSDYIDTLWKKINFSASEFCSSELEAENTVDIQVGGVFTPKQTRAELIQDEAMQSKYGAVCVKWFPKKSDQGDINEFLVKHGLSQNHKSVVMKENGQVIITDLSPGLCKSLSESITGQKFKEKKTIYCQPIALITPDKSKSNAQNPLHISAEKCKVPETPIDDFSFVPLPLPNSKLLDTVESDSEDEVEVADRCMDASDKWLTMNESKRRKKQKRKLQAGSPQVAQFKKQDRKTTPTGKKK